MYTNINILNFIIDCSFPSKACAFSRHSSSFISFLSKLLIYFVIYLINPREVNLLSHLIHKANSYKWGSDFIEANTYAEKWNENNSLISTFFFPDDSLGCGFPLHFSHFSKESWKHWKSGRCFFFPSRQQYFATSLNVH